MKKLTHLILISFFLSCDSNRQERNIDNIIINEKFEAWTDSTRKMVINEVVNYSIDSVNTDTSEYYIDYFYFHNGKKVKAFGVTIDKKDTVAYYYKSIKTNYVANGENCPIYNEKLIKTGGLHTYIGLKYNDMHIGTATSLQCDNSTFEKGFYFNGEKIGKWKTLNSNGEIIDEKDYGNADKLENFIKNNEMKGEL